MIGVLENDLMDVQFVLFSVSLFVTAQSNPVLICTYSASISTFSSDSKELVLFANHKRLHNWVTLPLIYEFWLLAILFF